MPRFRPKGMFAKSALQDLEKHTLSRISTIYGQLAYLASLRDKNSGVYRHHGLSAAFGRDEAAQALRDAHDGIFLEWLNLSLSEKYDDLEKYLAGLESTARETIQHWQQAGIPQTVIPQMASPAAREHFLSDMQVLLSGISLGSAGAPRDPGSTPPE